MEWMELTQMHLFLSSTILFSILCCVSSQRECGENQEFTSGGACPPRCQIVYKMCILPLYYRCYCKTGFMWNFEKTECIPEKECQAKWADGDYDFIVGKVFDENRGYEISCDKMDICDLSQIERDPNNATKIVDHTPIPKKHRPSWK